MLLITSAFSPLLFSLPLWRISSAYLRQLGSSWIRRKLADLVVSISPDRNLGKFRDVVNTMDEASRLVFNERQAALSKPCEGAAAGTMDGSDILSTLRAYRIF